MDNIKTYPDLNQRAMNARKTKELRLWYLLRSFDSQGRGMYEKPEAQKLLADIMTSETFRRTLNSGAGLFWNVFEREDGSSLIKLIGLEKVCLALGVDRLRKNPILVPIEACLNIVEFKAALFASWFTIDESNPISRYTLNKLFNIASSTQVRYTEKADIETIKHRAPTELPINGYVPEDMRKEGYYPELVDGRVVLCKRLPNSYYAEMQKAPRGRTKKVNQFLKSCRKVGQGESRTQRYFRTARAFLKSKHRDDTNYLWIRERKGIQEWAST